MNLRIILNKAIMLRNDSNDHLVNFWFDSEDDFKHNNDFQELPSGSFEKSSKFINYYSHKNCKIITLNIFLRSSLNSEDSGERFLEPSLNS